MLRQWRQTHKSLEHTPGDIWSLRNPTPLIYCPAFKVTFVRERATATPPSERRFSINRRFWPAFLVIDLFTTYTLLYCTSFAWSILHDRIKIFFVQGHRFVYSLVLVTYEALSVCVCVYICRSSCSVYPPHDEENLAYSMRAVFPTTRSSTMKMPFNSFHPARMHTGD